MSAEPLPIDRFRDDRDDRILNWHTSHLAALEHARHCTDCTVTLVCPFGAALEEMVDNAERALRPWDRQRIERAMFIQHDVPEDVDDRPAWLELLTIGLVGSLLMACAAVGYWLGVVVGKGG